MPAVPNTADTLHPHSRNLVITPKTVIELLKALGFVLKSAIDQANTDLAADETWWAESKRVVRKTLFSRVLATLITNYNASI
jgi:hypothetical protein